jgi:outer membrane protein OmpA-like peptidoglycan-associated protein
MPARYDTRLPLLSALLLIGTLPACASWKQRDKGAAIGAAAGAAVGGAIGKYNGSTAKGAIIGAVLGGAAGAIIGHQMDQQAKELQQNIPGAKVERVGEGIQVTFDSGILFALNSATVQGPALQNLQTLASSLEKYPGSDLLIVGHTDSLGTDSYNASLSERRAQAAANVLASAGVDRSRLQSLGRGETEPIADNASDAGRQQNRRVEVAIYAGEAQREAAKRSAATR